MEDSEEKVDYAVYVIFTRDVLPENEVIDKLLGLVTSETDLLFCRSCFSKESQQVNRYICCLKKSFYDHLIKNCNFKRGEEFNITKYRVNNEPLSNGMTYGFYIRCDEKEETKLRELFQKFETFGFLRSGSYTIQTPNNYPNGDRRGYVIVSFQKLGDRFPRQYIRKLRALINNCQLEEKRIHVNWASHSVLRDVMNAASKERKTAKA